MVVNLIRLQGSSYSVADIENNSPSAPLGLPEPLSLKSLIGEYGTPEMMFFGPDIGVPEYPKVWLSMSLIYPNHQFMVIYVRDAEVVGDEVISCEPASNFEMNIVDKSSRLATAKSISLDPGFGNLDFNYWDAFSDVTDTPMDTFFMDYLASPSDCISFPTDAWLYMLN